MKDNKYIIDPDKSWMNVDTQNNQELIERANEERGGMILVAYIFIANIILLLSTTIFILYKLFF